MPMQRNREMKKPIAKLREDVVKAAMRWSNYVDDGLAATAHVQGQLNMRLVKACAALASRQKRGVK